MERPQRSEDERRGRRQGTGARYALSKETRPTPAKEKGAPSASPLPNYQQQ